MHGLIKLYLKNGKVGLNNISLFFYRHSPFFVRKLAAYTLSVTRKHKLPKNRFVIFAQGRTGSTVLVDLLNSHPEIFTFGEIMERNVVRNLGHPRWYAEGICSLSKKPTTGFKVKVYQIERYQKQDPHKTLSDFQQNGWKIIYLKRSNILRHAISDLRSEMTREFHNVQGAEVGGKNPTKSKVHIQPEDLIQAMKFRENCLVQEAEALDSIPHLFIEYEKHLLDAEDQRQTMNRVFEFLGLPPHRAETVFRKVTSGQISDDVENFDELKTALERNGYAKFFEKDRE